MNKTKKKKEEKKEGNEIPPFVEEMITEGMKLAMDSVNATEELSKNTSNLTDVLKHKKLTEKNIDSIVINGGTVNINL